MRIIGKTGACFITLFLLLCLPVLCRAEVLLSVSGIGAIEDNNTAKAEQTALQDAFAKAMLQAALTYIPQSSVADLVQQIPEFTASRGTQDIVQYQILSRSRQGGILQLNVDVRLNDEPLREWISARALTTPQSLRPRVLLMIASREPGRSKAYEWWKAGAKSAYSSFEKQFSQALKGVGENVIDVSQHPRAAQANPPVPLDIAVALGADFLITGSIVYAPVMRDLHECSFNVTLIDVRSRSAMSSWSFSHKGDLKPAVMNAVMIEEVIKPIRSRIITNIVSSAPAKTNKMLCIEGVADYVTYQSMINALKSMDSVSRVNVSSIYGPSHTICHTIELKGSLSDAMENLKRRQITEADMIVDEDKAYVRIIH